MWLVKQVARRSRGSDWRAYFLIGCVLLLAALLAGASWSAWRSSVERTTAEQRQLQTLEVLSETNRLRTAALQMLRGERGFLLTGDDLFLEPYEQGRKVMPESLAGLARLTADDRAQQERIGRLEEHLDQLGQVLETMIEQERSGRHDEAIYFIKRGADRTLIESILAEIEEIEAAERLSLGETTGSSAARARANERYQYGLTFIGLALLVLSVLTTIYIRRAVGAEREARRELQRFASTDELTGLPNRRSFMHALERALSRAAKDPDRTLCLAIFDIDHFKRINDRFGHPAGDEVIREVGVRAKNALRARDVVGRIGGEEFAILLPKADIVAAQAVCERMRAAMSAHPVRHDEHAIPFTASIGIAELQPGDDVDHLLARADTALYEAKTGGRDKVCLAI